VVVVVGSLLPLLPALLAGRTLAWRDSAQLYGPLRPAVVAALRELRLPLWNPWDGTGHPLFAEAMHAVLHPVSLLLAPITDSIDAFLAGLVVFAALGTWMAARTLGASPPAAAGAALAYSSSGFVLGASANLVFLAGAASGPWAVAGMLLSAKVERGWLAAGAGVLALAVSGDVGMLAAAGVVGAALALEVGGARGLLRAALGALLGLGLAAIQLVPSWAFLSETVRGSGASQPGAWALAPWRLIELVAPGFFVGPPSSYEAPVFVALGAEPGQAFPFATSVFVGAPVMVLALLGARGRTGRVLLGLAAAFLWVALGDRLGARPLLAWVPIWGSLRYWEKMVAPVTLCLALAAGLGVDEAAVDATRAMRLALVALGAVVVGLLGLPPLVESVAASAGAAAGSLEAATTGAGTLARVRLEVGAAHAGAALAAMVLVTALARRRPALGRAGLAALLLVQSCAASPFALHAGDPAVARARPPALAADPPGPRLLAPLGEPGRDARGGLDAVDALQWMERRSGRPATSAVERVDTFQAYSGLPTTRWWLVEEVGEAFWALTRRFGCTHVLSHRPRDASEASLLGVVAFGATSVALPGAPDLVAWALPHRPWASFAPAVTTARGPYEARQVLVAEMLAGRPTVVVEAGSTPPVAPGRVLSVRRGDGDLSVVAESAGDALLVVNDAYAEGWRATVDGRPVEVLPADVLVRAVRWPAGLHRLEMWYAPAAVTWGAAISGSCLLLAAVMALLQWRGNARPPGRGLVPPRP
jgi:hypothetical protein